MIVTRVNITATLRSMEVGEVLVLPLSSYHLIAAQASAFKAQGLGSYHINRLVNGVRVRRYE